MATNQRNLLKKATFWSLCCLLFSGPISAQKVYPASVSYTHLTLPTIA